MLAGAPDVVAVDGGRRRGRRRRKATGTMLDPDALYALQPDALQPDAPEPDVPGRAGPVLVQALGGFIDAGAAGRLAREHLLSSLPHRVVARFDVDQLLDYRSRRPAMLFVQDHWEHYEQP